MPDGAFSLTESLNVSNKGYSKLTSDTFFLTTTKICCTLTSLSAHCFLIFYKHAPSAIYPLFFLHVSHSNSSIYSPIKGINGAHEKSMKRKLLIGRRNIKKSLQKLCTCECNSNFHPCFDLPLRVHKLRVENSAACLKRCTLYGTHTHTRIQLLRDMKHLSS